MPPRPEAIILVWAPWAPLLSPRVWLHAQRVLLGAMLAPGARTVTAAWRVMGLATERGCTNDHRVLNRATWSARQGRRLLLEWRLALRVPAGATIVLGADDTMERRRGRKITATGGDREAVLRSTTQPVIRGGGLTWVSMLLLVPVPWAQRVWALPWLTARCRPAKTTDQRRHNTRVDGVRHMITHVRRWLPGRRLVLVVDGGCAAVSLALACVTPQVVMVSRVRWDAARSHRPGPQPPGKRGPKPVQGKRQRGLQTWAARADTPWATVEVDGYDGQRTQRWLFSHTALWHTPGLPPVAIRVVLVGDPKGTWRLESCFCTDLQATPVQLLAWVVMRWSVEVTCAEARAHLGLETQRQWSDQAIARTTPVLLARFSLVTLLALQLRQDGNIPVPMTAWYRKGAPTFSDGLALVRWHLWRARSVVNAPAEPEFVPCPREAFARLLTGLPLAA